VASFVSEYLFSLRLSKEALSTGGMLSLAA